MQHPHIERKFGNKQVPETFSAANVQIFPKPKKPECKRFVSCNSGHRLTARKYCYV